MSLSPICLHTSTNLNPCLPSSLPPFLSPSSFLKHVLGSLHEARKGRQAPLPLLQPFHSLETKYPGFVAKVVATPLAKNVFAVVATFVIVTMMVAGLLLVACHPQDVFTGIEALIQKSSRVFTCTACTWHAFTCQANVRAPSAKTTTV